MMTSNVISTEEIKTRFTLLFEPISAHEETVTTNDIFYYSREQNNYFELKDACTWCMHLGGPKLKMHAIN